MRKDWPGDKLCRMVIIGYMETARQLREALIQNLRPGPAGIAAYWE